MLNLIKPLPFVCLGRIQPENLKLGSALLPVIPLGVGLGWWLTHKTEQKHYTVLIYAVLLVISIPLLIKVI